MPVSGLRGPGQPAEGRGEKHAEGGRGGIDDAGRRGARGMHQRRGRLLDIGRGSPLAAWGIWPSAATIGTAAVVAAAVGTGAVGVRREVSLAPDRDVRRSARVRRGDGDKMPRRCLAHLEAAVGRGGWL